MKLEDILESYENDVRSQLGLTGTRGEAADRMLSDDRAIASIGRSELQLHDKVHLQLQLALLERLAEKPGIEVSESFTAHHAMSIRVAAQSHHNWHEDSGKEPSVAATADDATIKAILDEAFERVMDKVRAEHLGTGKGHSQER